MTVLLKHAKMKKNLPLDTDVRMDSVILYNRGANSSIVCIFAAISKCGCDVLSKGNALWLQNSCPALSSTTTALGALPSHKR